MGKRCEMSINMDLSNKVKVLYIGGYGRSGSTLLVRLMGRLPGIPGRRRNVEYLAKVLYRE